MSWQVCGSTGLPVGNREREWDEQNARDRIFAWAGWEDHPDPEKARHAFFAYDDDKPTNLTSYKLPFADVVDGKLKAMPRGLFAVAQVLRGARDGIHLPEEVLRSARQRAETYYHKMDERAPWQEKGGTSMPGKLTPAKRAKTVRAARVAARTRKIHGTQYRAKKQPGSQAKQKRTRAASTAVKTRRGEAT
jgi:hypothetical protein